MTAQNPDHPPGAGRTARKSIARCVGEFVGHIWNGATSPVEDRKQVRRTVEEEERTDAQGRTVVLRRTTIEEIELRPDEAAQ